MSTQASIFCVVSDLLTVGFSIRHALQFCEVIFTRHLGALHQINTDLDTGKTVSAAFTPYIDDQIAMQLQLAEEHGQLEQSLGQVSRLLHTAHQRQLKIKRLLQYPVILAVILTVLVTGMKLWVIPQIQTVAQSSTRPSHWGIWVIVGVPMSLLFICGVQYFKQMPILKRVEYLAPIPVVGPLVSYYYGYYFLSTLTIMIEGGLGFQQILVTLRRGKQSTLLYQLGGELETALEAGHQLVDVLASYRFMPVELQVLLTSGKPQLELIQELSALTELYYQRLTYKLEGLLTLIQPIAFLIIGGVIVGTYASLFLPMYQVIGGV